MRARGGKFQSSSSTISTNSETLLYRGTHFGNGTIQGKTLFVVIPVVLPVCFPVELIRLRTGERLKLASARLYTRASE